MTGQSSSSPFTQAVVKAMRRLYPESLADKSWDNTGLLLEAPYDPTRRPANKVLLTVDLTKAVADEAIKQRASVVIAYHPIIFRGLKSLTLADTQQQSLLRLAAAGTSVYSPHTALDAAAGGLGDWLADLITNDKVCKWPPASKDGVETRMAEGENPASYVLVHHPDLSEPSTETLKRNALDHERAPIKAFNQSDQQGAGMGRIVRFPQARSLTEIVRRISQGIGNPTAFSMAIPQGSSIERLKIRAVAICAGSGGSLFADLPADVDLLLTGELSHHEALAQIEKGRSVICLFHSNSERGFLGAVLKQQLLDAVIEEWATVRKDHPGGPGQHTEALGDETVAIEVSKHDRDPFGIAISPGK